MYFSALIVFIEFVKFISLASSQHNLVILPEAQFVLDRPINGSIFLTCKLNNPPENYKITWFDNKNREITTTTPQTSGFWVDKEDNTVRLYIKLIQKDHEGNFTCKLTVNDVFDKQLHREIRIHMALTFKNAPPEQYFKRGDDAFVICEPGDDVRVEVKWKFKTGVLTPGQRHVMNRTGTLIKNSDKSDSGRYTCELEADDKLELKRINVYIQDPPVISKGLTDMSVLEGGNLSITCEAHGDNIRYNFFINGITLINGSRVTVNSGHVFISPLARNDAGLLICSASNGVGLATSTGNIVVEFLPIISSFSNLILNVGESAMLECLFEGGSNLTVAIIKLNADNTTIDATRIEQNTLHIADAKLDDAGFYLCEVNSVKGKVSSVAAVYVRSKPRASQRQIYSFSSYQSNTMNVTCFVDGYPPPTIVWYFNNVELSDNATFKIFHGEFESYLQIYIDKPDVSWIFSESGQPAQITCKARNEWGSVDIPLNFSRSSDKGDAVLSRLFIGKELLIMLAFASITF